MVSRRLIAAIAVVAATAGALASAAYAQRATLWPGVTFEQTVQFTPNGPVVLNVLVGPRPDGTTATALTPVLSNDMVEGRETLTAMQRRLASSATTAGVNGDFFTLATGRPSGIFMRDGQLAVAPNAQRSSAGILSDGALDVRRVGFRGTWAGTVTHPLARLNDAPPPSGTSLYTPAFGLATPSLPGAVAVVLFPFPLASPGVDLPSAVVELLPADTPVAIPQGGAVLVARGVAAADLQAEAAPGQLLNVRLDLEPGWDALLSAVGGGPQIVRGGAPVFRAGEAFTSAQLGPRAPRSAVGQRADGAILLVSVDGRQPGYSVGLTNFELAQALVRLGAVTAMAFDSGGSATMAFDGKLLNRPSGRTERAIASALVFTYTGVFVSASEPVVSPDGDGFDDVQTLSYRVVSASTATVSLVAPDGSTPVSETVAREPGVYDVPFPPTPAEGRWKVTVAAVDEIGRATTMTQAFAVNATLGFLRVEPKALRLPPKGAPVRALFRLTRGARVGVTVEAADGAIVRTFSRRLYPAGEQSVTWNGLGRDRKPVGGGRYTVRVSAVNALGRVEQTTQLIVRRIAAPAR